MASVRKAIKVQDNVSVKQDTEAATVLPLASYHSALPAVGEGSVKAMDNVAVSPMVFVDSGALPTAAFVPKDTVESAVRTNAKEGPMARYAAVTALVA